MDMQDLLDKYERALYQVSDEELDRILTAHDVYYVIWDEDDILVERQQVKTRKEKIDWILNTDPIVTEGGLIEFINDIKKLGLIKLNETEENKKITCPKCHKNDSEIDQDIDLSTLAFIGDNTDNVECWCSCKCEATWRQLFAPIKAIIGVGEKVYENEIVSEEKFIGFCKWLIYRGYDYLETQICEVKTYRDARIKKLITLKIDDLWYAYLDEVISYENIRKR